MKKLTLFLFIIAIPLIAKGKTNTLKLRHSENVPPEMGNFALPASQQPGPFFSFGQSLIDKNQV